jgi:hypothetical protein
MVATIYFSDDKSEMAGKVAAFKGVAAQGHCSVLRSCECIFLGAPFCRAVSNQRQQSKK